MIRDKNRRGQARESRYTDARIFDAHSIPWSPLAISGEPLIDAEIASIFEAARRAHWTFNCQTRLLIAVISHCRQHELARCHRLRCQRVAKLPAPAAGSNP